MIKLPDAFIIVHLTNVFVNLNAFASSYNDVYEF